MLHESVYVKIRVSVPVSHAPAVRAALGNAGAGHMGSYTHCSASFRVVGRFIPMPGSSPAIGVVGVPEEVEEEVIETICHRDIVEGVIAAVRDAHPYEEPAIDIMPRYEVKS